MANCPEKWPKIRTESYIDYDETYNNTCGCVCGT